MRIGQNLKLSQRVMLLVVLPLAVELVFLIGMERLLAYTEEQAKQLARSNQAHAQINLVEQQAYHTADSLFGYMKNRNATWRDRYESQSAELRQTVATVQAMVSGYPAERESASRLQQAVARYVKFLNQSRSAIERGEYMLAVLRVDNRAFRQTMADISAETQELTRLEKQHAIDPAAEAHARWLTRLWLGILLVVNVSVAILLVVYFNRGILSRLQVLMDNTRRLPRKEKLNPPVGGSDEIASLDQVFHEMAAALAEAERIKQEFVAMVSHDLRTPLTSIKGTLQLLSKGIYGEIAPQGKELLAHAEGSTHRLIKLVNDILDVEKLEAGALEILPDNVALTNVISRSVDSVQAYAKQHSVSLEIPDTTLSVYADEDRLVQVLVNLLSNAIKFSPATGTVSVAIKNADHVVEVRVNDQGRGVPAEHRQAIFERFRQVASSDSHEKGGTGLGLTICKAIIDQHGGTIGVDSDVGRGSSFWFRVPAAKPEKEVVSAAESEIESGVKPQARN